MAGGGFFSEEEEEEETTALRRGWSDGDAHNPLMDALRFPLRFCFVFLYLSWFGGGVAAGQTAKGSGSLRI